MTVRVDHDLMCTHKGKFKLKICTTKILSFKIFAATDVNCIYAFKAMSGVQ